MLLLSVQGRVVTATEKRWEAVKKKDLQTDGLDIEYAEIGTSRKGTEV